MQNIFIQLIKGSISPIESMDLERRRQEGFRNTLRHVRFAEEGVTVVNTGISPHE